jgi:hypothetical protein
MKRLVILAIAGLLGACQSVDTDDIGADVTGERLSNPAGQNTFSVTFDPNNPGVPLQAMAASGKDDDDVDLKIEYSSPDGGRVVWHYQVAKSSGSKQAEALLIAAQAIAAIEAETAQSLGPGAFATLLEAIQAALAQQ